MQIVDISDVEVTAEAGVFAVLVDDGDDCVEVLVYYELASDLCQTQTIRLAPHIVQMVVNDPSVKAECREAVLAQRDVDRAYAAERERAERKQNESRLQTAWKVN
jgi:hypothetical protein